MGKKTYQIGLNRFVKKIKATFRATGSAKNLRRLGEEVCRLIVIRSLLGYGVHKDGQPARRFKSLSESYVQQRRRMRLSPNTSARKSNITNSGQMLDSMRVIKTGENSVTLGPTGRRDGGGSNSVVARYVSEVRPFLYLSKEDYPQLTRFYRRMFGEQAKSKRLTFNQKL